jgi:putative addiction module component (TIGR02574 family)
MIAKRNELIDAALELPDEDRAEIAQRLIDSLPLDWGGSPPISEEWISEVERRVQEIRSGSEKTIPHDDVVREIDRKFQTENSELPT